MDWHGKTAFQMFAGSRKSERSKRIATAPCSVRMRMDKLKLGRPGFGDVAEAGMFFQLPLHVLDGMQPFFTVPFDPAQVLERLFHYRCVLAPLLPHGEAIQIVRSQQGGDRLSGRGIVTARVYGGRGNLAG